MQVVTHLGKLRDLAARRALSLRMLIENLSPPVPCECDHIVAYVTIEALNLWASFARSFYLSCTLRAKRITGPKVSLASSSGIRSLPGALDFSVKTFRPNVWQKNQGGPWSRRDEPAWHDPSTLLKLSQSLGASNASQIVIALSTQAAVFQQLPTIRNFFAHRNEETARKAAQVARSIGLSGRLRPSDILCTRVPSRPQNVLADWLDDLRITMELICR